MAGSTPKMRLSSATSDVSYNWKRYWTSQARIFDLSDAGFLRDPEHYPAGAGTLKTSADLEHYPALALLGEPGIGKSAVLNKEHERVSALQAEQNIVSDYIDLKFTSSEDRLYQRIFESNVVKTWKDGNSGLHLHLDSLDESILRIETVAHVLADGLRRLPKDRLTVRIACRTVAWPAETLGAPLREIWGDAGLGVFKLAPLRRRDVVDALSANDIDPDEFIPKLFGAHAVAFAIKPLTLNMLISLYQRDGRLPGSTADLYRQGCLALCEEQNHSRRETGRRGRLNPRQRLRLAGRIASVTVLGHRSGIWTGPESASTAEYAPISTLAGATENGELPQFTATDDDVREVLDTGLFSSHGDMRVDWAHQTYGAFLAAFYLGEKGVPAANVRKILTHPRGGLIPHLAITGAWATSLIPDLRTSLVATDPWTLLRGDLSSWTAANLLELVDSMLSWVEHGRYFEQFIGISESYERLAHPDLAKQLRKTISDRSGRSITRSMALRIAERCKLKELQPELIQCAFDRTEASMVRAAAVSALSQCGDDSIPALILSLLQGDVGPDPDDEIRGCALDLLWPEHITAAQLLSFLTRSNETHHGRYAHVLFTLADTLKQKDLPSALAWATEYIGREDPMREFREKRLVDAIMFKCWDAFEDPALTDPLLAHVAARLRQGGALARGSDTKANKAFLDSFSRDPERRHSFFLRVFEVPVDHPSAWSYHRASLITSEDFAWLLAISPGGTTPIAGLNEQSLLNFIRVLFQEDPAHFEAIHPICQRWPLLRSQYTYLFDGIPLDSEYAQRARDRLKETSDLLAAAPPPLFSDLPAEILKCLTRAESGIWMGWAELNLVLKLTSESRGWHEDLNYSITTTPGWVTSDETVRQRIVAGAGPYLVKAESYADRWVGHVEMSIPSSDATAIRAFLLLREHDPDVYQRIQATTWAKWASLIVGIPRVGTGNDSRDLGGLLRDALDKAPQAFIATVHKMVHMDKARRRIASGTPPANPQPPVSVLRDLDGCWDHEDLLAAVFEEMTDGDVTPAEYAAMLEPLYKAHYRPAIEHGIGRIGTLDASSLPISDVLLRLAPLEAWPYLWPKLVQDEELAKSVFGHAASSYYFDNPFYAGLDEEAVADIYLLMERLFPPRDEAEAMSGFIAPLDMIPTLRDGAPRYLANLGSEKALRALRRLVVERPGIPLLPFELSRGEVEMRAKTWSPLTTKEVFALTDRPSSSLVTSAADLLEVLESTLAKYARELHGAQTPVRDLWDRQGTTNSYRPIDENGFSDALVRYLRIELGRIGIFANREVEVSRKPGTPVGRRTDILINAVRRMPDGTIFDPIAAVIEVKGCWNSDLFTSLDRQLVQDYMVEFGAPIGIYLTAWFDLAQWDDADSRRAAAANRAPSDIRQKLDQQAAATPEGFQVKAIVLEIRAPGT